jgi:hypothetical protein
MCLESLYSFVKTWGVFLHTSLKKGFEVFAMADGFLDPETPHPVATTSLKGHNRLHGQMIVLSSTHSAQRASPSV